MLDVSKLDLDDIATALEDRSEHGEWWIDADTGEVWHWDGDLDDDPAFDPEGRPDARLIEPLPSSFGYRDMADFIVQVPDRRAASLLDRAIAGRGAFRRFKDTLFEFPELRQAWFRFRDNRLRRRAVEFLVDEGLVDPGQGDRMLAELLEPKVAGDVRADPREVAAAVAADLRQLYGERLAEVVLYGSQAREDAHPDSDVDLAVVLDEVASPWDELRRMDHVMWRHTLESGLTVSVAPISAAAWATAARPLILTAKTEGVAVG